MKGPSLVFWCIDYCFRLFAHSHFCFLLNAYSFLLTACGILIIHVACRYLFPVYWLLFLASCILLLALYVMSSHSCSLLLVCLFLSIASCLLRAYCLFNKFCFCRELFVQDVFHHSPCFHCGYIPCLPRVHTTRNSSWLIIYVCLVFLICDDSTWDYAQCIDEAEDAECTIIIESADGVVGCKLFIVYWWNDLIIDYGSRPTCVHVVIGPFPGHFQGPLKSYKVLMGMVSLSMYELRLPV